MKRFLIAFAQSIFLILLVVSSTPTAFHASGLSFQEDVDSDDHAYTTKPVSLMTAPEPDDEHFVADAGGELDQYLFRTNGDGYIRFDIPITRYYFNEDDSAVEFDNGFLTGDAIEHLVDKHILPEEVTLRLSVFDVDEDASWCPEVDYLYVNDNVIYQNGSKSKLSGANDTWSTPSFQVPIDILKFPMAKGTNGNAPQPTQNEIAIQVDALECTTEEGNPAWAVEVDWGVIEIPSPIRPIIFAHGWTGTTHSFDDFEEWMAEDGIPSAGQVDLQRGIYPITQTANWLAGGVYSALQEYGVNKVNIFSHSKGGLVMRRALSISAVASHTEHAISFASPHHGTERAAQDKLVNLICWKAFPFNEANRTLCFNAAQEFRIDRMRNEFNYTGCVQTTGGWENCRPLFPLQSLPYFSFAANGDQAVIPIRTKTFPWVAWLAGEVPFPENINVDEQFDVSSWFNDHSGILEEESAYKCAIAYIAPEIYSKSSECPSQLSTSNQETKETSEEFQTILSDGGVLPAGGIQLLLSNVDGGSTAIFEVYSDVDLIYTLETPSGATIDPSVAETDPNVSYTSQFFGDVWVIRYEITNPESGNWHNNLETATEASYAISNLTNSSVKLSYKTDQYTYQPGSIVTLEAGLLDGSTPLTAGTLTGFVTHPDDSTIPLTFYDDGTNGDVTPNDGIYTTHFTATAMHGHALIALNAVKNDITRIVEATIAITTQTAQFQQVASAFPVDANGNGLYDSLNLNLSVNIVESGEFEFQGTLVDSNGQPITIGYYSTWMDGSGPLPAGLQTIVLSFDGAQIYQHGSNGPYTLADLTIFDVTDFTLEVDSSTEVYTTATYQVDQFEHPLITLSGGNDTAFDYNSNGRYDFLQITLSVNVVQAGTYEVNGRLVDPNGREIAWTTTSFYASGNGSYEAILWFDGYDIGIHQVDGPYMLKDLSIFNTSNSSSEIFGQAFTTQDYGFIEFEGGFYGIYLPSVVK